MVCYAAGAGTADGSYSLLYCLNEIASIILFINFGFSDDIVIPLHDLDEAIQLTDFNIQIEH